MPKKITIFFLIALLCLVPATQAQESIFSNPPDSFTLGDLSGQDNWTITKPDPNAPDSIQISTAEPATTEKFIEIINDNSIFANQSRTPLNSGVFEFKVRHNKSGLFYLYAQTSDNGGQLLFSIQFTEAKGILLEKAEKQITLLPDYNSDQWYWFTIDFDNTRGDNGTFTLQIDGQNLGEYEYVESESELFDLAQITIGSESAGKRSISGFVDTFSSLPPVATSTASDALLQLSISLSSTSISSNLENGLIVTATLDGIAGVATSSILVIEAATSTDSEIVSGTSTEADEDSSVGDFIMDIVEGVIEIFTPEENPPEETIIVEPLEVETEDLPPSPPEETPTDEPVPENEVESSISTEEATNNEITTATF
jgi:hypothetical protein